MDAALRWDASRSELEAAVRAQHEAGNLRAAATRALEGYGPEILGYLVATLRSDEAAAEVFSQFCLDLWTGLPGFEWRSSFRTWAYMLARHAAIRVRRSPHVRRSVPLEVAAEISA